MPGVICGSEAQIKAAISELDDRISSLSAGILDRLNAFLCESSERSTVVINKIQSAHTSVDIRAADLSSAILTASSNSASQLSELMGMVSEMSRKLDNVGPSSRDDASTATPGTTTLMNS